MVNGEHKSIWLETTDKTNYPKLEGDYKTDILIIGGGLVGIILGYLLKKQGIDFIIAEMHRIGNGVTGHSSAKITSQHGLIYTELSERLGKEKAFLYANANETAVNMYKDLIKELSIDCDLKEMPNYVYTLDEKEVEKIYREVNLADKFGLSASFSNCEWLPFKIAGAIKVDGHARFHPLKFVQSLAREISRDKDRIFENTAVRNLEYKEGPLKANTDSGTIHAKKVIIATNYPFVDPDEYFMKLRPRQSYVIAASTDYDMPLGMYISTEENFRSFRPQPYNGNEIWFFGGEPQIVGREEETAKKYKELENWAKEKFKINNVYFSWTTHDLKTIDSVPMVGKIDKKYPNILVATGFKGWGITNTMASAKLLADLVGEKENQWLKLYDPSRKSTLYSGQLLSYNVPTIARLISGNIKNYPEAFVGLGTGDGGVYEIDNKKIAAYKDEKGNIHAISAKCTHMGCTLHFNKAEKSWDCPCHGSRFDIDGEVIHSPASRKLGEMI